MKTKNSVNATSKAMTKRKKRRKRSMRMTKEQLQEQK